jgi:release factor glutamine methyltransferase
MVWQTLFLQYTTALQPIYNKAEAKIIITWLFEHVSNLRHFYFEHSNERVPESITEKLAPKLTELLHHKPIQYVIGTAYFYHNYFLVNQHTLIPRPETEELVDLIIKEQQNNTLNIIDIGTGSGCIAISLKNNLPNCAVTAIDFNKHTITTAQQNCIKNNSFVNTIVCNFLNQEEWPNLGNFDVIVSNPPYIALTEKASMQPNVLNYEPHTALFVYDNDPLLFYKKIHLFAKSYLNKHGIVYLEINQNLAAETAAVFYGTTTTLIKDINNNHRILKVNY